MEPDGGGGLSNVSGTRRLHAHTQLSEVMDKCYPEFSLLLLLQTHSSAVRFIGLFLLVYLLLVIVPLQEPGDGGLRRARNAFQEGAVVLRGKHNLVFGHIKLFWWGERRHSSTEKGERLKVEVMSSTI